jgi:molybdopterin synthase catalytic subunit
MRKKYCHHVDYQYYPLFVVAEMTIFVSVTREVILVQKLLEKVTDDSHGALNLFIGTVRNVHEGKDVKGITYDGHEALIHRTLDDICRESARMWPDTHYSVCHYLGELSVGGISVAIAVSSAHRTESFDACRYIIEEVKKRLPVWKQEHYAGGKSEWLPGHSLRKRSAPCCGHCGGSNHG